MKALSTKQIYLLSFAALALDIAFPLVLSIGGGFSGYLEMFALLISLPVGVLLILSLARQHDKQMRLSGSNTQTSGAASYKTYRLLFILSAVLATVVLGYAAYVLVAGYVQSRDTSDTSGLYTLTVLLGFVVAVAGCLPAALAAVFYAKAEKIKATSSVAKNITTE